MQETAAMRYLSFTKTLMTLGALWILMMLSSCGPEENPQVDFPDPGIQVIEISASNRAGHYYSLAEKKIISDYGINDWDLKFCSQNDKFYIYLNTAKNMQIARYGGKYSDPVSMYATNNWVRDVVKGGKEISAIGEWGDFSYSNPKSYGYTYLVNRGQVHYIGEFGYRKIQVLGCANGVYHLVVANPGDSRGDTLRIEKKPEQKYVYVSLDRVPKVVDIEPPMNRWDLLFTQYGLCKTVALDSTQTDTSYTWTDYVILNNEGRMISCDTARDFNSISFWTAENYTYHNYFNYIGNRWRYLDAVKGRYELSNWKTYIIRDTKNHIYKIQFTSVQKPDQGTTRIEFRIKNL